MCDRKRQHEITVIYEMIMLKWVFKEQCENVNWISLVWDRVRWQAPVSTKMKTLWFHIRCKFFDRLSDYFLLEQCSTAWSSLVGWLVRYLHFTFQTESVQCSAVQTHREYGGYSRSQWPRGLRNELFSPTRTLRSWVRIPLEACMPVCVYSVCAVLCAGNGLATGWFPDQGVLPTV
jgi:hypothetical protein